MLIDPTISSESFSVHVVDYNREHGRLNYIPHDYTKDRYQVCLTLSIRLEWQQLAARHTGLMG